MGFGAAFLWSKRSTLFVAHPDLDFLLHDSMCWAFTTGWQEDLDAEEFSAIMAQMNIFALQVVRYPIVADTSSAFFMRFQDVNKVKNVFGRLRRLRWRWRIKQETPFFAYPRRIDVH